MSLCICIVLWGADLMSNDEYKNCPYCDEKIKAIAVKCRYCKSMLDNGRSMQNETKKTSANKESVSNLKVYPEIDKFKGDNKAADKECELFSSNTTKAKKGRKTRLAFYILAGILLFIIIGFLAQLEFDETGSGNTVSESNISGTSEADDNSAVERTLVDESKYDVESLWTADSHQRSLARDRLYFVQVRNELGFGYWLRFLDVIYSEDQSHPIPTQQYVEHVGEPLADHIIQYVIPPIIDSEDYTKRFTNDVWRNEVFRYYFDASIDVQRLKITHIKTVIDYYWTGDEDLMDRALYYEQMIYSTHEELYGLCIILAEALSSENYDYLVGKEVVVDVESNNRLLVKDRPGPVFNTIDKLARGTKLEVYDTKAGDWLAVNYLDEENIRQSGYVHASRVSTDHSITKETSPSSSDSEESDREEREYPAQVFVDIPEYDNLNLRSGPGTDYSILGKLRRGIELNILNEAIGSDGDQWYQVITPDGKEGWVHSDYVTLKKPS